MSENPDVWEDQAEGDAPAELVGDFEPAPEGDADAAEVAVDVPEATAPELEGERAETPRSVVAADAKSRAGRSAFQSALVTAIAAVCGVAATYLHDGDVSHLDWKAFAMAALVAGGQPVASYLHRMLGK